MFPVRGLFITFEGTEGGGKSTQISILAERCRELGRVVRLLREPGGTPIGEEIRHTLKHSDASRAMTPEAELLLMNASRAQLVREVVRPALERGEIVLCDRFHDSTVAYQGYGRGLDLTLVREIIRFAVGDTQPDITFLLEISVEVSEQRRAVRLAGNASEGTEIKRDRFEEEKREFFERVEEGYRCIAQADPARFKVVDASRDLQTVATSIWEIAKPLVSR